MALTKNGFETTDLEIGDIEENEGNYKISIKYTDIFGNIVEQLFLTQDPQIEDVLGGIKKKILVLSGKSKKAVTGKLNGVGGLIVNNKENELKKGDAFMVGIGKGNFNLEGQYWLGLKSLTRCSSRYTFTTSHRKNKNPFSGKLSSNIIIGEQVSVGQYQAIIKGLDIVGNECDIDGILVVNS